MRLRHSLSNYATNPKCTKLYKKVKSVRTVFELTITLVKVDVKVTGIVMATYR